MDWEPEPKPKNKNVCLRENVKWEKGAEVETRKEDRGESPTSTGHKI